MSSDWSDGTVPAIDASDLHKEYGDGSVTAVDDVSLTVDRGEVVGLLGPNGAGKTTTIKMLLGLITPDTGRVQICGIDVQDNPSQAHAHVDAMLEGDRNVYWRLTVRENLAFFAGLGGYRPTDLSEHHKRLLERLDLHDRADSVVNELSTGMKQKVSLASTLARDVDVIFLDEPTLGLDVETSLGLHDEIRRLAEQEDVAIVITSHDMDVIEAVSDRVVILQNGQIIVNDRVDELVELFETQAFRIAVSLPVATTVQRRLDRLGFQMQTETNQLIIESQGVDSQTVYDLMRVLEETDQELRSIDSGDPDLEEVFLTLTDDPEAIGHKDNHIDSTDSSGRERPEIQGGE